MRLKELTLSAALLALAAPALAAPITALYVFGDSLSDNGNLAALSGGAVPAPPYSPGRASNGPVAVEYLALRLGLAPLLPASLGGTNFAVIGAATGNVPLPTLADPFNTADNLAEKLGFALPAPTGMLNGQLLAFAALHPGPVDPDALFVIWGGANDVFLNPDPAVAAAAAGNIGMMIDALYGAGARRFLVPNLPDLGRTPGAGAAAPALSALTGIFNGALHANLAAREGRPGIELLPLDTAGVFAGLLAHPSSYGLTNVTDACVAGSPLGAIRLCAVEDEGGYLFWDGVHPTTAGHQLLGAALADAIPGSDVPEPLTSTLLGLGCVAVGLARRRAA